MMAFITFSLGSLLSITNPVFTTNASSGLANSKDEVNNLTNYYIATTNVPFYDNAQTLIANGATNLLGTFTIYDGIGRGWQFNFPSKASAGTFSAYVGNSLANDSVTNLAAGTNQSTTMFSTTDYSSSNQLFVWNTNFWLYRFKQRTAIVVGHGNSPPYVPQISGGAVSPRHVLWPVHAAVGPGTKLMFIDDSNQTVIRTVLATTNILFSAPFPDIEVILLDTDLPSTIHPFNVLPNTISNSLPTLYSFKKVAVAVHIQTQMVGEKIWTTYNRTNDFDLSNPAYWHPLFNVVISSGDSGGSVMLAVQTNLCLVGHLYGISPGDGYEVFPDYATFAPLINSAMHYLSTNNSAGSDYQLTTNDLSSFAFY